MSCGLKNSLCQGNLAVDRDEDVDLLQQRFAFVDGDTGSWTLGLDYGNISCPVGGMIVFHFPVGAHDVVQMASREDWDSCRFNDTTNNTYTTLIITPEEETNQFEEVTYYYNCTDPGSVAYLTCSVPGHCEANQKVLIETSETEYAYDTTTGNWTLHVDSLSRVLRLLGYRQSPEGFTILDRGYQTEELADVTTHLIWCALDHCPDFAHDFDASATLEDCESIVLTLLGFVSRKRPIPQWNVSEDYYQRAVDKGGSNVCTARSYLSQLYMTKGDWENATLTVASLCQQCQDEPVLIQQARLEYDRLEVAVDDFNFDQVCSSGAALYHVDIFQTWMASMLLVMVLLILRTR